MAGGEGGGWVGYWGEVGMVFGGEVGGGLGENGFVVL